MPRGGSHHADGVQALHGDELGLDRQQDVAHLAVQFLVAAFSVTAGVFAVLGHGVLSAFTVPGLAGDVVLVFAVLLALPTASRIVGTLAVAGHQVVLVAAVGAHNVSGALDVHVFPMPRGRVPRPICAGSNAGVPAVPYNDK